VLKLGRVGYSPLTYPIAYGLISQTWYEDNDLLDVVVANVTKELISRILAELRVIGIMKF
jgi:inorganic pyrophosphatase